MSAARSALLACALSLSGCSPAADLAPPASATASGPSASAVFPGAWRCADSSVVWRIEVRERALVVSGRDLRDSESLEVSEVSWDGGTVASFASRAPSTGWAVTTTLRVLDPNRIRAERAGDSTWSCVLSRVSTSDEVPPSPSR